MGICFSPAEQWQDRCCRTAYNGVDEDVILLRLENSLFKSNEPNKPNQTEQVDLPIDSDPDRPNKCIF